MPESTLSLSQGLRIWLQKRGGGGFNMELEREAAVFYPSFDMVVAATNRLNLPSLIIY